jgi:hypothetical protein
MKRTPDGWSKAKRPVMPLVGLADEDPQKTDGNQSQRLA